MTVERWPVQARRRLAAFPLRVAAHADGLEVHGLPPALVRALLSDLIAAGALGHAVSRGAACRCGIKTAVVPAGAMALWAAAMGASPFGSASVTEEHPYLGALMVSSSFVDPPPQLWEPALLDAL
eukprot:4192918-Alexandrium_andersonii.AAC.1